MICLLSSSANCAMATTNVRSNSNSSGLEVRFGSSLSRADIRVRIRNRGATFPCGHRSNSKTSLKSDGAGKCRPLIVRDMERMPAPSDLNSVSDASSSVSRLVLEPREDRENSAMRSALDI
jgi:hypothetical protein